MNGLQAKSVKKKEKTKKYIKRSVFDTCIHGGRNGGMYWNIQDRGFIYKNGKILCMSCNGRVMYRGRKMITNCICVKIEHIDKIRRNSCETIISQISQPYKSNKWSAASSSALIE